MEKNLIDEAGFEDINVEILSSNKEYGDEIHIINSSQEFTIDVEGMNPWKLEFCNVDGGEVELAIGVYKESPHHKDQVHRVFFYNIDFKNERLKPKLRISRLNNPLVDFIMEDIDRDGYDEIISIEKTKEGRYLLGGYNWTNFAFERSYFSKELEKKPEFLEEDSYVKIDGHEKKLFLKGDELKWN